MVEIVHVITKNFNTFNLINRAKFDPVAESAPCNWPLIDRSIIKPKVRRQLHVLLRVSTCLAGRFVSRSEEYIILLLSDTDSKSTKGGTKSAFDLLHGYVWLCAVFLSALRWVLYYFLLYINDLPA